MLHNDFVYLFLVDLHRIQLNHDYKKYVQTESGYGACMLKAYMAAFNAEKNGLMSVELIHTIHKEAMAFKPDANPGQYKSKSNGFKIAPSQFTFQSQIIKHDLYNATKEGINEFAEYWLKNNSRPIHKIFIYCSKTKSNAYCFEPYGKGFTVYHWPANNKITPSSYSLDYESGIKKIQELIEDAETYFCSVTSFYSETNIKSLTTQKMQEIVSQFNTEIKKAKTSDEKIWLMAEHLQHIDQLHPYNDGNIRTLYILLNKLLRDHNLSLTLLMNPNRLDVCSTAQLVEMIKQGQEYYQQLIQHNEGNLVFKLEKEFDENIQLITCIPQALFDISDNLIKKFIDYVILDKPQMNESFVNNRYTLLSNHQKDTLTKSLMEKLSKLVDFSDKNFAPLKSAINKLDFSLALRWVCAKSVREVIETLLNHDDLMFDPMEQSSNKNNAFDWVDVNNNLSSQEKGFIKILLSSCQQKKEEARLGL